MTRSQGVLVGVAVLGLVGLLAVTSRDAEAGPPSGLTVPPLVLKAVSAPTQYIPAVPAGESPEHAYYTVSATGPFCIQGFVVSAGTSVAASDYSTLWFGLNRIDGHGMSHESFTLVDGSSGGFAPQDLIIDYGTPLCAAGSLEFHATSWASAGDGVEYSLSGIAIVQTAANVVVTITPDGS